jgi:uncharacterized membrane protein YobD (UPF0266 family)
MEYSTKDPKRIIIEVGTIKNNILYGTVPKLLSILLSIYVIPINYFALSVILILFSIALSVYKTSVLVISDKGLHYTLHWKIKWNMIDNCRIDETKGILHIQLKNGTQKQVNGIPSRYYSKLYININNRIPE